MANPARRGGEAAAASEATDEGENENGASSLGEPSVARGWRGRGAEVLERDQSKRSRGAAGEAGLRSAFATLKPPCVPLRQPGKPKNEKQPTKGTFSRELNKGHF